MMETVRDTLNVAAPDRSLDLSRRTLARRISAIAGMLSDDAKEDVSGLLARATSGSCASEVVAQATSGLMHVHGLERGSPRRVGVNVASVACGALDACSVVAADVARARGTAAKRLQTALLPAALLFLTTRIARDTAHGAPSAPVASVSRGITSPLPTRDGHRIELEALDPVAWQTFWAALGVPERTIREGWVPFVQRYAACSCRLPVAFQQATQRRLLCEIAEAAAAASVSVCRLRANPEVLESPGIGSTSLAHISELPDGGPECDVPSPRHLETRPATGTQGISARTALPLHGIRVVEVTTRTQGPLAGQLLRMLGAEVLRVEPRGGDPARLVEPMAGSAGAYFVSVNRGKIPTELDLSAPAGRSALRDLVADADVFLHNWRPGRDERWELDAKTLARCNPRLVYAAQSGWGAHVPPGDPVGVEYLVQAHAGLADSLTPCGEAPAVSRVLLVDTMGAVVACEGVLSGLLQRERTGRGCEVRTSLLAGAMTLQEDMLAAMASHVETGRVGGRPVWVPLDEPVATADGHVAIDVADVDVINKLCEVCDVDTRAGSVESRSHRVVQQLATDATTHWEMRLRDARVPCARVCDDIAALPEDARVLPHLERVEGAWVPASPWRAVDAG